MKIESSSIHIIESKFIGNNVFGGGSNIIILIIYFNYQFIYNSYKI